jgi:hypothetical protein
MRTKFVLTLVLIVAFAAGAMAQPGTVELKGSVSWALAEGVSFPGEDIVPPGETDPVFINRFDLSDGITFGAGIGYYLDRNWEVAFLWDHHRSEIFATGERDIKIDDMGIDNYHGVFVFNFGSPIDKTRPMLFGGLGSTYFRSVDFVDLEGRQRSSGGEGRFSSTWGGGLKIFPSERFGIQLDFKWTPTWIKSEPGGIWCDYWGCYSTSRPDYANQWKFGGTLIARF